MTIIKKVLIFILLFCLSIVFMIFLFTYSNRDSKIKNGFSRTISKKKAVFNKKIPLEQDLYAIADVTPYVITLYNYKKPYELLKISLSSNKIDKYRLENISDTGGFNGLNTVRIKKDSIFVLGGRKAIAYQIVPHVPIKISTLDSLPFYQSDFISSNSFIFMSKTRLEGKNRRILKKVNWGGKVIGTYIPEKQNDGYFCTDGKFAFDDESNRLIYLFYYRGSFTCLDTNLNVLYTGKTVDTVVKSKVHIKAFEKKITQATPPHLVNKRLSIANDNVYIHSALKADNEGYDDFNNSEIIDVYGLQKGKYIFSFYLPRIDKRKLTAFKVHKQMLVALYGNMLVVFLLPELKI